MNEHRARMNEALKRRFVPTLRGRGFKGSFPYFHRPLAERVDYLMVQFYSSGGSFVLEVGRSGPNGLEEGWGSDLPIEKLDPTFFGRDRQRLTPRKKAFKDHHGWWAFGPRSYDPPRPPEPQDFYDAVAEDALAAFVEQGEAWLVSPPPESPPPGRAPWPFGDGPLTYLMPWNRPRLRIACLTGPAEPALRRREVWETVMPAMDALVALLPQPAWIRPHQSPPGRTKELPFGRLKWNEESNRTWTTKYLEGPEPAQFLSTEFWSPGRESSVGQRKDPDFYARIDEAEWAGEQGFVLALRLGLLATCGAAADAVLAAVEAVVPGIKRAVFDRGWEEKRILGFIGVNNLDDVHSGGTKDWAEEHPRARRQRFAGR